jgi:putative membrane protein
MIIGFLIRALLAAVGLWVASKVINGISYARTESLIAAGLILGLVNAFIRPILVFFTFPITILTLGLFLLVINGLMLMLVGALLKGFNVNGLVSAILGSIVVSVVVWIGSRLLNV